MKKTFSREARRRRNEVIIIGIISILILIFTTIEMKFPQIGGKIPVANNIIIFSLININIIPILLLIFLVIRNLVKLIFERKRKLQGAKLRTKLVAAFVSLSLVPTILLFLVAVGFITNSVEHWFSAQVEQSLQGSLEVAQTYYRDLKVAGEGEVRTMLALTRSAVPFILLAMLLLSGCSSPNDQSTFDANTGKHIANWLPAGHMNATAANLDGCADCHGADFAGGISKSSCGECHMGGATSIHPVGWVRDACINHGSYSQNYGTTACANAYCHGTMPRRGGRERTILHRMPHDAAYCQLRLLPCHAACDRLAYGPHEQHGHAGGGLRQLS